ncbi:hypothetical protein GIB67_031966 [Kingdonia uniflora]|uniref:AIPP2-like SPOC-like domain-containing protein n=1 Tax=Kingdonia uniflora TaxID=39325 RepID=A0A7J7NUH6_9MAGN|nr:hypothetical protein GIB67_031966 [Kingdonia uniflora]
MNDEYKKLEVLAFEMETTIASLEEDLARTNKEKDEILLRNEVLTSDVEATYYRLSTKNSELEKLEQEVSSMRVRLAEFESSCENMESSIKSLPVEKEELAMLLTNALLELVEEKAIWVAKEKASFEFIMEKVQISKSELSLFLNDISEVKHELEFSREECKAIREMLEFSEEKAEYENKCRWDTWPKGFELLEHSDDNIALFFFPELGRDVNSYDLLVDNIIKRDLALKTEIDNGELLVFSSCKLPEPFRRFLDFEEYGRNELSFANKTGSMLDLWSYLDIGMLQVGDPDGCYYIMEWLSSVLIHVFKAAIL